MGKSFGGSGFLSSENMKTQDFIISYLNKEPLAVLGAGGGVDGALQGC